MKKFVEGKVTYISGNEYRCMLTVQTNGKSYTVHFKKINGLWLNPIYGGYPQSWLDDIRENNEKQNSKNTIHP